MFKRTITTRWLITSTLTTVLVFIILNVLSGYALSNYFYSTVRQQLEAEASKIETSLRYYSIDTKSNFKAQIRTMAEEFEDKEKYELLILNENGKAVLTSSGFEPTITDNMSDYTEAIKTGITAYSIGKTTSGEKIMSITIPIPTQVNGVSALRLVVSLEQVDRQLMLMIVMMVFVSLGILLFTFITGSIFIKSIVDPVREIGRTAREIASGDFTARVENKHKSNDEIGELCDIVNYMADELSNADQMKNDFISSVSHELRTPLTAIKGWAETLNGVDDPDTISKGMRVISTEADRLSSLVEELLDFSRIQNGRFTLVFSNMDVLAELEDAILIYQEGAKRAGIVLNYNAPEFLPIVYGDKNRLRQVFINVIDNAIKYSETGSEITITAEEIPDNVKITIKDTGCGIKAEDLPKVKTKFFKANTTKRGSGIGLAVADEIVNMHNGTLIVTSKENIGTTVEIILPAKKAETEQVEIVNIEGSAEENGNEQGEKSIT